MRVFALAFFVSLLLPPTAIAATEAECAALTAAGVACDSTTVVTAADRAILQTERGAEAPHAYLKQRAMKSAIIQCLQPEFAKKLQNLVKGAEQQGHKVLIRDGFRSNASQAAAQARGASRVGPCGSYHNYGLAVDFHFPETDRGVIPPALKWIRENAGTYGLRPIGLWDPEHIQDAGRLPSSGCGACGSGADGTQEASSQSSPGRFGPAPSSGIADFIRRRVSGYDGANRGPAETGGQCAQLERACNEGGHSACMQFAQQCQQGAAPPNVPQGRAPTGAGTAGVPSQGTQGISQAFAPPTPPTPPTAPLVNSQVATGTPSTQLSTTAPTVSESIASIVVTPPHTAPTTTPRNPLPTTVVTYLAEAQVRITPTANAPLPPPTTIPPRYTSSVPTFGEASFDVQARADTFDSTARYTAIAQQLVRARLLAESLLHHVPQPFSSDRYWAEHNENE